MQQPPITGLKQCPYQYGVVTLAHETLVLLRWLSQYLGSFLNHHIVIRNVLGHVLFSHYFAKVGNQLFFDVVGLLTILETGIIEPIAVDQDS